MEVFLSSPIDLEQVADLCAVGVRRRPPSPRDTSKWHVTNLLESARRIVKGDVGYYEGNEEPSGIMSMGRIWESAIDSYLCQYTVDMGGAYIPDVELERDGVVASLDGMILLPKVTPSWMVCETKLRFSRSNGIPFHHLQQVRSYCMLAVTDVVCYISGHITSNPPEATARMEVLKFTRQSIVETWEGILNTKKYLESMGCCPQGTDRNA